MAIEATAIITSKFPAIGVIAFSMFDEEPLVLDMLKAGAKGYLLKNVSNIELFHAIKQ